MVDFLNTILSSGGFEPHSTHFIPDYVGLMRVLIITNVLIGLTYLIIPAELFYIYIKRKDFSFRWVFLVIIIFGVWCSASHLIAALIFFYPAYWLAGVADLGTGLVSFAGFIAYVVAVPMLLKLAGPEQLNRKNQELSNQVEERKKAESDLLELGRGIENIYKQTQMKNSELNELNKVMLVREAKMAELKKEIARLQQGRRE